MEWIFGSWAIGQTIRRFIWEPTSLLFFYSRVQICHKEGFLPFRREAKTQALHIYCKYTNYIKKLQLLDFGIKPKHLLSNLGY